MGTKHSHLVLDLTRGRINEMAIALPAEGSGGRVWRELVLVHEQLLNGGAGGILQAELAYISVNPSPTDTFIITDGITTETFTFVALAGAPFEVTIAGGAAATQTNLITAINTDSVLWSAVGTVHLDPWFAALPAAQFVVYRKTTSANDDRIYGVQTNPAGIKVVSFSSSGGYETTNSTESNIPAVDPAVKKFGFSRAYADLIPSETHMVSEGNEGYTWDGDGSIWIKVIDKLIYESASNPTVNNDIVDTAGTGVEFRNGDAWLNTTTKVYFICVADTATAARWEAMQDCTYADVSYYADGTAGSDANTGLSVGSPKKTLTALFALCPYIVKHTVTFNLVGTFSIVNEPTTSVTLDKYLSSSGYIVLDGGANYTDYAGPFTLTANEKLLLTVAAAGWGVDDYAGYMARIDAGAQSGALRTIIKNDATTMNLGYNLTAAPGNVAFTVVRPTTTLLGNSAGTTLNIKCSSDSVAAGVGGSVYIQRLYMSDWRTTVTGSAGIKHSAFLAIRTIASPTFNTYLFSYPGNGAISFSDSGLNLPTETRCGAGLLANVDVYTILATGKMISFSGSYSKGTILIENVDSSYAFWDYGWRVKGQILLRNVREFKTSIVFGRTNLLRSRYVNDGSTYGKSLVDSAVGSGIEAINCDFTIVGGVNISDCSAHGVSLDHSLCKLNGIVVGTGNTGAGVYATNNSTVNIANGSTPTITGTVGNISFDGTTQATTWAVVDGGTSFTDLTSCSHVKEV
jgi:hypothetical protein